MEGTVSLPIPHPGNTCLASRPALEDKQKVYTHKAHIWSSGLQSSSLGHLWLSQDACAFKQLVQGQLSPSCSSPFMFPLLLLPLSVQGVFRLMDHQKSSCFVVVYSWEGNSGRELVRWIRRKDSSEDVSRDASMFPNKLVPHQRKDLL